MTINATSVRVSYAGNGVTLPFSYPSRFLADGDLAVLLVDDVTGVQTTQILTTHYTVSGAGDAAGGTVTFVTAPPTGKTVVIFNNPALTQGVDLVNNDPLPVETGVERPFDRLTLIAQRNRDLLERALRLPDGDSGFVAADMILPAKVTRKSNYLAFDANGKPIASAAQSGVPTSTFMATVLDDVTGLAALTTLVTDAGAGATRDLLQIEAPYSRRNIGLSATVAAKALTIAIKGRNLSDPSATNRVDISFRNATLTTGDYANVSAVVATSVVVPSGATLGFAASGLGYVYVYAINNGGTIELAVSRKAIFSESGVHSTTAIGTGSDSGNVLYSTTARANVAVRLVGCIEITTGAVAGEWDNAPVVTHVVSESRSAEELWVSKNVNLPVELQIRNASAGNNAMSEFRADNGTGACDFGVTGTGFSVDSTVNANEGFLITESTTVGLIIKCNVATGGYIRFSKGISGTVQEVARFAGGGALCVGHVVDVGGKGNIVLPNNTNYGALNGAGNTMIPLLSLGITDRVQLNCNSTILNFDNAMTQAGTGAVATYLRVRVGGVDRVIPVHAEA